MGKLTKAKIDEARHEVDEDLRRVNAEISVRIAQRRRLEEERQRLADLMNEFLASELASLQGRNQ